ncbi:MAG TPA: MliC family protein [Reyranellaceae bacterium]|nr:MliC family protein [Reyranellaceae bacterium]
MGGKRTKRRLSIIVLGLMASACLHDEKPRTAAAPAIERPSPDDATPAGITYLCEGRKQVNVVYARNRATVTHDGKTWRLEYQQTASGFRYFDALHEWAGTDALAALRQTGQTTPLAFNCRPIAKT